MNPIMQKTQNKNAETLNALGMEPFLYDIAPPKFNSDAKSCKINLDSERILQNENAIDFITNSKLLLVKCDLGLSVEELIINYELY